MNNNDLKFKVTITKITKTLIYTVIVLILFNLIGLFVADIYILSKFHKLFYMELEGNVPAYFSSIILLLSSCLLFIIATKMKAVGNVFNNHWKFLSFIFFYMSIDESSTIHEKFIKPLRDMFDLSGIFYFSWVIVGIVIVIIIGIIYFRFLFKLPNKTRNQFIIAASLYVGGAIGLELLGGYYSELYGEHTIYYSLIITIEESLEMFGIVVFINALLNFIYLNKFKLQFKFIE